MSHAMLPLHRADIYPEQPWFVLSAAQHYSLIPGSHPAISQFYSFEVAPSASLTLAVPDGCVDILLIVMRCDPWRESAAPRWRRVAPSCSATIAISVYALHPA